MTAPLALAPVSRPIAKLLHELQAQIIRESAERQLANGETVLRPLDLTGDYARFNTWEANGMRIHTAHGRAGEITLRTWYCADPEYPGMPTPGVWSGSERRLDESGRAWESYLPHRFVQDDFGTLVPVGAA